MRVLHADGKQGEAMTEKDIYFRDGNGRFLFALGRNAIYAAFLSAGLKAGDKVLTPAYDCDGTLQPFRAMGIEPVFYRSDPYTFKADISDIRAKLSCRPKMVHVINHFGFPQQWEELLALRGSSGVPILEDNAYSLFSSYNGRPFGSFGDFAIFSLRKNLPLTDGGMIIVNNGEYTVEAPKKGKIVYSYEYANFLTALKRMMGYYKAPELLRKIVKRSNPGIEPPPPLFSDRAEGYPEWPPRDKMGEEFSCDYLRPISRLARWQLGRYSAEEVSLIAGKKRHYYGLLASGLSGNAGTRVLWPTLPEGIVPFSFNILLGRERDAIFGKIRKRYDIMSWPTLPMAVINRLEEFPEVGVLGRRLLQINLASDKVTDARFERYLEKLIKELSGYL